MIVGILAPSRTVYTQRQQDAQGRCGDALRPWPLQEKAFAEAGT